MLSSVVNTKISSLCLRRQQQRVSYPFAVLASPGNDDHLVIHSNKDEEGTGIEATKVESVLTIKDYTEVAQWLTYIEPKSYTRNTQMWTNIMN